IAVRDGGIDLRHWRPKWGALLQREKRRQTLGRVGTNRNLLHEAQVVRGAKRIDHWSEAARSRAAQRGLAIQGVGKAEPRSDAAEPVRRQRTGILPARTGAGEH